MAEWLDLFNLSCILMHAMRNFYLYVLVCVGGAAVLALEILGTRILGPFYGVSLFLWSALITVTLAALSLGYLIGGRSADKRATLTPLCIIMMGAGTWIMLIPWFKHPFLTFAEPLGLRAAVLTASFILFFPPLTFLGMISPYAVKLRTATLSEVGKAAGNLYATSTLASVISALLTGFYLIPNIGVTRLTIIIGMFLLVTATVGFLIDKNSRLGAIGISLLAFSIIALLIRPPFERAQPYGGLLSIEQSPYAELRVLDSDGGRHLLIDGGIHSLVDTATWESNFHYTAVMDLPKYFFPSPGKMLLIGLGGGSLAKQYARSYWKVDAVEIDPTVISFARRYFHLQLSDASVYEMDGRQFLISTKKTYDVILLDAFGSSSIPFHLVTKEVFGLISSRLNPGGILALNVETVGWNDPIVKTLTATLKQIFQDVFALPIEEPPDRFGNIVLLASKSTFELKRELERNVTLDPDWRFGPEYQKVHAWDNRFTADIGNAQVLTDDLNPVDLRAEAINLVERNVLHEYFKERGMSW